jgi:hypothetical protein
VAQSSDVAAMIPYDVDPSLHSHEPQDVMLDDGFSRRSAATHPVEPEPMPPGPEPVAPNPSHLPVEPEFGPQVPPSEADNPQPPPPKI